MDKLNKKRSKMIAARIDWKHELHERLRKCGLKVTDLVRWLSEKTGKKEAQLNSLFSVGNVSDDLWKLVEEFFKNKC